MLAGGHHTARGEVPPAGVHVLVVRPPVDEEPPVGGLHDDRDGTVPQVLGAHAGTGHDLEHRAVGRDVLDQLTSPSAWLLHDTRRTMPA
jgi:hypothetical protein